MSNIFRYKQIVIRILCALLLLILYAIIRFSKTDLNNLQKIENQYKREIINKENIISDLKNELKMSSTKSYIEQQARLDGFIMPDDLHFVYDIDVQREND